MSARPDLTTEELIAFVEEMERAAVRSAAARNAGAWNERDGQIAQAVDREAKMLHAIAQRLHSERPAVTPGIGEIVRATVDEANHQFFENGVVTASVEAVEARLAALSVSSTEGKP